MESSFVSADGIRTADLTVGEVAQTPLYDESGTLIISQGSLITGLLVSKLRRNGIVTMFAEPPRSASETTEEAKPLRAASTSGTENAESQDPVAAAARRQAAETMSAYSPEKLKRLSKLFDSSFTVVESMVRQSLETGSLDLKQVDPVIDNIVQELTDDADPVVARTLVRQHDLDLTHRCVQFSILAIGVAKRMNLSGKDVSVLGRAALAHDWALFELPHDQRFPHQQRSDEANATYKRHPIASEQLLAADPRNSSTLSLIVGQVHERMDGSGFPRQSESDEIHPLSRILAVVDMYLSLTNPPSGFPRVVPPDAIAYLVSGMSSGKFAPIAVSGLLETVSLYPLGSLVELSDTSRVRPIATNGSDYGYPIVQDIDDTTRRIDLKSSDLFVTRPIPIQAWGEVRLPDAGT